MLSFASHWPMSMAFSRGLPWTIPATKPPANASPAPLVSLILSLLMACTATSMTSGSLPSLLVTAMVGSVPWVKTTVLGLLVFFLGRLAIFFAISLTSLVSKPWDSANAAASVSLPIRMSTYGMTSSRGSLKNCEMNGAERLRMNCCQTVSIWNFYQADQKHVRTLFFDAASSASALMAGTQTVKWKPPT